MEKRKISISYDRDVDVVYLTFGEPVEAIGEEIEEGIFARYDPKTEEIVGLTIINFSKKFGVRPTEVVVPIYKNYPLPHLSSEGNGRKTGESNKN